MNAHSQAIVCTTSPVTNPNNWAGLLKAHFSKGLVNNLLCRCVQIRLDGSEAVPAADGHHHPRVHLLIDQQPLREASTEVVATHLAELLDPGFLGSTLGCALHSRTDTTLLQVDG